MRLAKATAVLLMLMILACGFEFISYCWTVAERLPATHSATVKDVDAPQESNPESGRSPPSSRSCARATRKLRVTRTIQNPSKRGGCRMHEVQTFATEFGSLNSLEQLMGFLRVKKYGPGPCRALYFDGGLGGVIRITQSCATSVLPEQLPVWASIPCRPASMRFVVSQLRETGSP